MLFGCHLHLHRTSLYSIKNPKLRILCSISAAEWADVDVLIWCPSTNEMRISESVRTTMFTQACSCLRSQAMRTNRWRWQRLLAHGINGSEHANI